MKKAIKLVVSIPLCALLLNLLFLLFSPTPAMAHKMFMTCKIKKIEVQVEFEGGSVVQEARVTVLDPNGEVYFEGMTDENGKFSFEPDEMEGKWEITAVHSGHKKTLWWEGLGVQSGGGMEIPLYARIFAGFGYLTGIAGVALVITERKARKESRSDRVSSD